jgi:hypothetical protein
MSPGGVDRGALGKPHSAHGGFLTGVKPSGGRRTHAKSFIHSFIIIYSLTVPRVHDADAGRGSGSGETDGLRVLLGASLRLLSSLRSP